MVDNQEINVVREEPAPCHIKLNIEVPQETVKSTFSEVEKHFRSQANLPGFRQGKAPWKLIRRKYGEDIQEEAKGRVLRSALQEAVQVENLTPETAPHVDNQAQLKVDPEKEFVFAAEFDVAPDFELPEYKGLEVEGKSSEVEEEEVETFIDQLMEQRTSYEKADKKAQKGDLLKASYEGQMPDGDDENISDTAKYLLAADDTWIALREPEILPGIADKLIGADADSDHEIQIEFPEEFYERALAGKTVPYKVHVDEVHEAKQPDFTDDMAQQLGAENVADAREKIKDNLGARREQEQAEMVREEVVEKLTSRIDFPLPPRVLADQTYNVMSRLYQQRQEQGASQEELQEKQDELRQAAEKTAETRLKRRYVLRKVAEAEEIQAESEDIQGMIKMLSQHHKMPEKELIERLQQTGGINELLDTIIENKATQRLVELADIEGHEEETAEAAEKAAEAAAESE
ncbi:MAG: trigger factor [Lentisphaeria bacterium]